MIAPSEDELDRLIETAEGIRKTAKNKHTVRIPKITVRISSGSVSQETRQRDDQLFAELLDDEDAVATAVDYLTHAPVAFKGGMHDTAVIVANRCGDFGCRFDKTIKLMSAHWTGRGDLWKPGELAARLQGLFDARENALGCDHPRAWEILAQQDAGPFDANDYIIEPPGDAPQDRPAIR